MSAWVTAWLIRRIQNYQGRGGGDRLLVECNFSPSCSHYAIGALEQHGLWRGLRLTWRRLRRCTVRDQVGCVSDPVPDSWPERLSSP